jgi:hypothetical protein
MQQRRVRLGDILDDYCPRERRITNHAVVAMIEDEVKQTRCSTCDADHEYKAGKAPTLRRRKVEGALVSDVEGDGRPELIAAGSTAPDDDLAEPAESAVETANAAESTDSPMLASAAEGVADDQTAAEEESPEPASADDVWVHRPLIRAQLPRPEGHVPERKEPEFTMRSAGRFDANRNGQRPHRGPRGQQRQAGQFGDPRQGQGGQGSGFQGGGFQGGGNQGERNGNRAPQPGQRSSGRPGGPGGQRQGGGGQNRGPKRGR